MLQWWSFSECQPQVVVTVPADGITVVLDQHHERLTIQEVDFQTSRRVSVFCSVSITYPPGWTNRATKSVDYLRASRLRDEMESTGNCFLYIPTSMSMSPILPANQALWYHSVDNGFTIDFHFLVASIYIFFLFSRFHRAIWSVSAEQKGFQFKGNYVLIWLIFDLIWFEMWLNESLYVPI